MLSSRSIKGLSLITLTVQNSMLTILLRYSRTNTVDGQMYSAATAVFLNELLKLVFSYFAAVYNQLSTQRHGTSDEDEKRGWVGDTKQNGPLTLGVAHARVQREVFSTDCWKLAIPACLYVLQNNLQFVAASNLDIPTFQVTYNLKILTTAVFSVLMLNRRLSSKKWLSLVLLAAGVGIVQLQSAGGDAGAKQDANPVVGLVAVASACITSGIAGVYFEMVLKGTKADIWVRNIQLSIFSLLPAMSPALLPRISFFLTGLPGQEPPTPMFAGFGFWAWAVVLCSVAGGLVTAVVIKYADNLLKGFATALSIVLSFAAGVLLFDFQVTTSFLIGTAVVVGATMLYNQPDFNATGGIMLLPSPTLSTSGQNSPTFSSSFPRSTTPKVLSRANSFSVSGAATTSTIPTREAMAPLLRTPSSTSVGGESYISVDFETQERPGTPGIFSNGQSSPLL
ncbi:nucleotide-sugar transporter [Meredithblackwellia eburnea MCA 4105]